MSSSAVAQQVGATAGDDPRLPAGLARPRFSVSRRIATDSTVLGAGTHCRQCRPAARCPPRIDTGVSPVGVRGIVRPAPPTGGRP
jgi:hypothetical protein